ncbi:MAG: AMP-binding protein [Candidatus Hodarchaeota archaeon]
MEEKKYCDDWELDANLLADYKSLGKWRPHRPWMDRVPDNIAKTVKYPNLKGAQCILKRTAKKNPNNLAIYDFDNDKKYTYREFNYNVDQVSAGFLELGIKKQEGIAFYGQNCPEYMFSLFAANQIGAVWVPINPLLKKKEILHILNDSGIVSTIIVHENQYTAMKRALKSNPVKNLIVIQKEKEIKEDIIDFDKYFLKFPSKSPEIEINTKEDLLALMYTGGTTGLPKGVMLTHQNIISNTLQALFFLDPPEGIQDKYGRFVNMAVLPLAHIFGLYIVYATVISAYLNIMLRYDAKNVLDLIQKYKVNMFSGVPTHFNILANYPDFNKYDITSLELITSAGAALPQKLAKIWKEEGKVTVKQGYGLTECSPATHLQPDWLEYKPDSIGIPIIDTDCLIVDPEDVEKEYEVGRAGELIIHGPQVMKGYWKKPEATEKVIKKRKDGKIWLRTGDIIKMDENGYFYVVGRSKEMIKYKGYRILPFEVENTLYDHPDIQEAAVIGIPDDVVGEKIKAFIKLKPESKGKVTEEQIIEWAKENMAGYKYPREVEFVGIIPKSPVGKVLRRSFREQELKKRGIDREI